MECTYYLQQGHGMLSLNLEFVGNFNDTGVILSPRSCERSRMEKHVIDLKNKNAKILFDPQFYNPRTTRENILSYPYWGDIDFQTINFATIGAEELCERVINYQTNTLSANEVILPGRYANTITESWLETQHKTAHHSKKVEPNKFMYSTLCLGAEVLLHKQSLDRVINEIISYPVEGIYLVLETPAYLIDNELYIFNLLDALLSLTISGKKIIIGYSNQQSLVYSSVGVSGLATGNFRNVRAFNLENFDVPSENETKRKAVWYYDGNTLSEFRPERLGLAYNRGLKGEFGPPTNFSEKLLNTSNPLSVVWREPDAFRHYLSVMRQEWLSFNETPPSERINKVIEMLEKAKDKLIFLNEKGFRADDRSFKECFEPTLNALTAIAADRKHEIKLLDQM
ncbi:hypothetical protein ACJEBK_22165 [Peribacillus frigoritolerans]|uniref:hypothetical protein n=1 Tax=Peribacillus frigoritolerans TaxID=450367 RepID=UPI0038725F16